MNRWIASGVIKRGEPFSSGIPLPQLMTPESSQTQMVLSSAMDMFPKKPTPKWIQMVCYQL